MSRPEIATAKNKAYHRLNVSPQLSYGSSGAILVVDDELTVRKVISSILSGAGYDVFTADSGDSAVRLFNKHANEITLLLVDVVAPGMSGPELVEQLSRAYLHLKVLYMSGYCDSLVVRRFVVERGFPMIAKPFKSEKLLAAVGAAIGPARAAVPAK